MLILAIIVLGMGAGALAQLIVPTHQRVNWGEALFVGLIGWFVGGLLISRIAGDGLRIRPSGIIGSIVGASGCFYAIRRALHEAHIPPGYSRDFASALVARERSYRAVSVNEAVCFVPRATSLRPTGCATSWPAMA